MYDDDAAVMNGQAGRAVGERFSFSTCSLCRLAHSLTRSSLPRPASDCLDDDWIVVGLPCLLARSPARRPLVAFGLCGFSSVGSRFIDLSSSEHPHTARQSSLQASIQGRKAARQAASQKEGRTSTGQNQHQRFFFSSFLYRQASGLCSVIIHLWSCSRLNSLPSYNDADAR